MMNNITNELLRTPESIFSIFEEILKKEEVIYTCKRKLEENKKLLKEKTEEEFIEQMISNDKDLETLIENDEKINSAITECRNKESIIEIGKNPEEVLQALTYLSDSARKLCNNTSDMTNNIIDVLDINPLIAVKEQEICDEKTSTDSFRNISHIVQ